MKNATHSIYEALAPYGIRILPGEMHPIPLQRLAAFQWSVCRNPYDRAVSIWASTALRNENDRYFVRAIMLERGGDWRKFKDFVAYVLLRDPKPRVPFLFEPQHLWQKRFSCDFYVPFENLQEEISDIVGQPITIQKKNRSERGSWEDYMDEEAAHLVEKWAGKDFNLYGYEKWRSQTSPIYPHQSLTG